MNFNFQVSEQDFREAQRVYGKYTLRRDRGKIILWASILLVLLLLWVFMQQGSVDFEPLVRNLRENGWHLLLGHGHLLPLTVGVIVGLVWLFVASQRQARKNFSKSPTSQGEFAISLTPEDLTVSNSAGTSSKDSWNLFELWLEGKNVIVLVSRSGNQFVISVRMASAEQRSELCSLLANVLPKR
jgi:hypothetical protein